MRPLTRTVLRQPRHAFLRPLSTTPPRRLKEDKRQDPQEIEKAKQEQLKTGNKKGELKSASEQAVGADQQEVTDHDSHIDKLQKETAQQQEKDHPAGKS